MKSIILTICATFIFSFACFAQDDKASINGWRGLIIDESTFEQAKEKLGEPVKDKPNEAFKPIFYSRWFGNKLPKGFRVVKFKNIEGFDNIYLTFRENKLVVIEMDMKKDLSASALTDSYDTRFYPLVGNYAGGITPNDLAKGDRELIYPEKFPLAYYMGAANDKTIGFAYASAGMAESFAAGLANPRGGLAGAGIRGTMPGLVRRIQLISRTLENKTGSNLLK